MSNVIADLMGQLRQALGTVLLDAGEQLLARGSVHEVRVLQAGRVFTGVIADEAGQRRRVYVQYQGPPGASVVAAECSCTEVAPCAHVAAVCVAAARQVAGGTVSTRVVPASPAQRVHPTAQQCLYYCLARCRTAGRDDTLSLSLWVAVPGVMPASVQADSAVAFEPRTCLAEGRFPRYVARDDEQILRALDPSQFDNGGPLRQQDLALLPRIVATGRAHWGSLHARPLCMGAPRRLQLVWRCARDGVQRLAIAMPGTLVVLLGAEPALYIDLDAGMCGLLEPAHELPRVRDFWSREVPPEQIAACAASLPAGGPVPPLLPISIERHRLQSVGAQLLLTATPACELRFLYNSLPTEQLNEQQSWVRVLSPAGGVVYEIERDHAAEERLQARLRRASAAIRGEQRSAWLSFMVQEVPALQAEGWDVVVATDFPFRLAPVGNWYTELTPQRVDGDDWFDLRFGVTVEGEACNLLPALVEYLQSGEVRAVSAGDAAAQSVQIGEMLLLRLTDGRFVPVPMTHIERIAQTLVELFERDVLNGRSALSLQRSQVSRLAALQVEPAQLRGEDEALLRLMAALQAARIVPLAAPAGLRATLRPYQADGLGWLQFLRNCGLGGILADDMGLGKTLQTLAHLLLEKQRRGMAHHKPSLIVAPVSVIGNWQREIRSFAPQLELVVLHGVRRREAFASVAGCDVVLTGYPQLLLDENFLLGCDFALLVLDEAQMIKNPRTRAAQVTRALRAEQRLCLTGTPLENHLGELWSLMDFAQPGLLGSEREFQRWYRTPIEKDRSAQRTSALRHRVAPFLLRRTKDAVATDLPDKTQIIESIALDEQQRDLYDAIRLAQHRRVQQAIAEQGLARSQLTLLDALLKLRQVCCDPRLLNSAPGCSIPVSTNAASAKLQWLVTVLPQLVLEGRRALLFSQFTSMLSLIETTVRELGIDYCLLTGTTRERDAQVVRFQSGSVPLFLISLKAGGTGLNLTAADTVIHYDPWWNPAVEAQATDRAHRIGQRKPVFVYKLIAQDTVEEKILKLQATKHELANQLYGEHLPLAQLSATEIAELLAP